MIANVDGARAAADSTRLGRTLGFMRLLFSVDHALDARSKRMLARFGLTAPQRLFLRIVGRYPGIAPGEVASIMEVHPSTLSGVLRRMHSRKWIVREGDAGDRRRSLMSLTSEGRRIDELRSGTVEEAVRRALARCAPKDIEATERVLRVVGAELQREDA
ncbi:MAG: MarR family transcriptional regulator [Planctomycetes bacterium]|nr:MarR family transcriptional regulator [Planctomycetota bacterium]